LLKVGGDIKVGHRHRLLSMPSLRDQKAAKA
jgi:hypothetical protein